MQPGEGLVFVTRQAQSKIDKVLRGSPGAMADVLRPFSELQGKKQQRAAGQAAVTITGLFFPPNLMQSRTCQPPHIPSQEAPLFFVQVCAVLVEIRVKPSRVLL